ncbi:MAG: hypothetical protein MK209_06340 [Planctomycetes bacterium]|nr:hypothetical protein [Planctomycetota bacterium]
MKLQLPLLGTLLLIGCQGALEDSNFPTLPPRERALYTTLVFGPGGQKIELAGLTRQLQEETATVTSPLGDQAVQFLLRANRKGTNAYAGTLQLRAADGSWSAHHILQPRSTGRWKIDLRPTAAHHGWQTLHVEIEPDPFWEMDLQRPPGLPRAFGR